jgi:hypothetical protein
MGKSAIALWVGLKGENVRSLFGLGSRERVRSHLIRLRGENVRSRCELSLIADRVWVGLR